MEPTEEKQYTPEEVKALKEGMMSKWEAEIPFLEKQAQYERLITELEELQMRQVFAKVKTSNLIAEHTHPEGEQDPSQIVPQHERKLKK